MANEQPLAPKKKTGLFVVYAGIACLLAGYGFLAKGDITIAPFLIIGSFVVMGVGIVIGWD
jgi:predicted acyltransferase